MTKTYENFEEWLKEHDEAIRADERAKLLKEICENEKTMIDDDGMIHFVVKMVDVMKVFNKEVIQND